MINVVIPCLNEEHYIGSLLESLSKQTFKKFDVTVVDGYSKDKTREIVTRYQDVLPLTLLTTKKRNVGHQRNIGAKAGHAKYILFLDADMILHRHFLSQLVHDVRDRDVANCWLIPLSERQIDKILYNLYNIIFLEVGKYIWPVAVGNNLFTTRKMFEKIGGFDEKMRYWEDYDYLKRGVEAGASFAVLRRPRIYASVRRFEMQGRLNYLMENLKGLQYAIRTGKMPTHIEYPMGLDYSKLHLNSERSAYKQKTLEQTYSHYLNKSIQLLKDRLQLNNLDKQSQKAIRDITSMLKRVLT